MESTLREFQLIIGGYACFETVVAGVRLGLFSFLRKNPNKTSFEIQRHLHIPPKSTRILLLNCCSLNLLVKDKKTGTYKNTMLADTFLTKESPQNLIDIIEIRHSIIYPAMFYFTEALQKGKNVGIKTLPGRGNTISQRLAYDRKLESKFQKAMSSASMLKSYLLTLSLVDLGKIKHLLDLGGGDGTIALWLQKKYPKMKISIFELPSVCRMARKNIKKHGLSHKISVIPGNFFEDSFPEDVDAMLFCKTLPNFSPETNQKLIKKCYDSLPKGGMLIISDPCCNEEQTGPLTAALYASYYLTLSTGEGMIYTVGEYIKWLRDAGFSKVRNYANSFEGHCVIVGVKQ